MTQTIDQLVNEILSSRKYREMGLCAETVQDLLERELRQTRNQKDALKAVRQKLHNVTATYLGDPDYPAALQALDNARAADNPAKAVREICREILSAHASTLERLPLLEEGFYERIFQVTGRPKVLLDVACGLNPFCLPWMELPSGARYHAYDIHGPRVDLINHFFSLSGLKPLAEVRDVLVNPPAVKGDLALIFKEAHRMEQRQRGANRPLWEALQVRWLAVSLPAQSLSGKFDLVERERSLVREILGPHHWPVTELMLGAEMVFLIDKSGAAAQ